MHILAIEGLTKRFPTVTALDRLTVTVGPGVTGLVGANGAGKSTLIKILLGLLPVSEGRAAVLGLDAFTQSAEIRRLVGYMPEHECLPPDVSATELVVHLARMSGLPRTAARERAADVLRHVGLAEERYRPIGGYSTGMKQRVKLAQAIVHDPKLIFLGEPTNGLDPRGRDEMLTLIRRIGTEFGISVLVTSHLLGELERVCDHVIVIDSRRLLRSSAITEFTQATETITVEVEEGADALAGRLAELGQTVTPHGRMLLVKVRGPETYDAVRDATADLDLCLIRLEQGRNRIEDVFRGRPPMSEIYDIGYRHYDGPRLGRRHTVLALGVHSLRGVFGLGRPARSKIMPFSLAAIMMFPVVVSIATMAMIQQRVGDYSGYAVVMQAVVAIFLASQAPTVVAPRPAPPRPAALPLPPGHHHRVRRSQGRGHDRGAVPAGGRPADGDVRRRPARRHARPAAHRRIPRRGDHGRGAGRAAVHRGAGAGRADAPARARRRLGDHRLPADHRRGADDLRRALRVRLPVGRRLGLADQPVLAGRRRAGVAVRQHGPRPRRRLPRGPGADPDRAGPHRRRRGGPVCALPEGGLAVKIELSQVSRWYGNVVAVNDVTMTIGPGVTGLLGPNGAKASRRSST
ncbi:ATP-binding cassette domain-containing protein [Nonomuraea ferruginea]